MFIETFDGGRLYYKTYGSDNQPAVLLLHGLGADHNMWKPQIDRYPAAGLYVIAPDLRGHGKSIHPQKLRIKDWVQDIVTLLDHLKITSCAVAGVSMGGVIAQQFAIAHPDRVDRLILSDTFAELQTAGEKLAGKAQLWGFKLFKLLLRNKKQTFARLMASAYKPPYAREARQYFEKVSVRASFDQLIMAREAINTVKLTPLLPSVSSPCLVLVGTALAGKTMIRAGEKIARALPQAEFAALSEAMDPSNLVNPEAFDNKVLPFLLA